MKNIRVQLVCIAGKCEFFTYKKSIKDELKLELGSYRIIIGEDVAISFGVVVVNSDVVIGSDTVIGHGAIIHQGVRIANDSIILPNSNIY